MPSTCTLINLSNHDFLPEQHAAAKEMFGEDLNYIKIPFPIIKPDLTVEGVIEIVKEYLDKILSLNPQVVHIAGELVFVYNMVTMLQIKGILTIASTTSRIVEEDGDTKVSKFRFMQFRKFIS